jgi:hypothetical protein
MPMRSAQPNASGQTQGSIQPGASAASGSVSRPAIIANSVK